MPEENTVTPAIWLVSLIQRSTDALCTSHCHRRAKQWSSGCLVTSHVVRLRGPYQCSASYDNRPQSSGSWNRPAGCYSDTHRQVKFNMQTQNFG